MISVDDVITIAREALYTIIITGAPCLLVSLVIGLLVSVFQTVTSIQEQTLTFVPKILNHYDFRSLDAGYDGKFYDQPLV